VAVDLRQEGLDLRALLPFTQQLASGHGGIVSGDVLTEKPVNLLG
jgi:hypothetical protein